MEDLDDVLRIEEQAFEYPWTRDEFEYCLNSEECKGFVVERENKLVGYLFYEVKNGFYRLLSFAVDELERRRGVGSFMLGVIFDKLNAGRSEVSCFVSEKNAQAQLFLRSLGFRDVRIAKRFYRATNENACRMIFRRNEWTETSDDEVGRRLFEIQIP